MSEESKALAALSAEEYLAQRVQDQIDWHCRKSQVYQRRFKFIRWTEIGCAALIPLVALLPFVPGTLGKVVVAILGALVGVLAAVQSLHQNESLWHRYRLTSELLKSEKLKFQTRTAPYDDEKDNFQRLVVTVESILNDNNQSWVAAMREGGKVSQSEKKR